MKMKFSDAEAETNIEEVVTDYANFVKQRETREFLDKWKKKGFKKVGVTELLFRMWLLYGAKRGGKAILREAGEILEKLKGEGGWLSFLSDLKLVPERLFSK